MNNRKNKDKLFPAIFALLVAPIVVPLKMAADINKAERRAKNKRKGRHR